MRILCSQGGGSLKLGGAEAPPLAPPLIGILFFQDCLNMKIRAENKYRIFEYSFVSKRMSV